MIPLFGIDVRILLQSLLIEERAIKAHLETAVKRGDPCTCQRPPSTDVANPADTPVVLS